MTLSEYREEHGQMLRIWDEKSFLAIKDYETYKYTHPDASQAYYDNESGDTSIRDSVETPVLKEKIYGDYGVQPDPTIGNYYDDLLAKYGSGQFWNDSFEGDSLTGHAIAGASVFAEVTCAVLFSLYKKHKIKRRVHNMEKASQVKEKWSDNSNRQYQKK